MGNWPFLEYEAWPAINPRLLAQLDPPRPSDPASNLVPSNERGSGEHPNVKSAQRNIVFPMAASNAESAPFSFRQLETRLPYLFSCFLLFSYRKAIIQQNIILTTGRLCQNRFWMWSRVCSKVEGVKIVSCHQYCPQGDTKNEPRIFVSNQL